MIIDKVWIQPLNALQRMLFFLYFLHSFLWDVKISSLVLLNKAVFRLFTVWKSAALTALLQEVPEQRASAKKIKNEGSSGKKVKPDSTFSCHLTTQKCGDEGMWLFFFLERSLCLIAVLLFYCEFLYMMWFCTAATLTIDQVSLVKEIFWSQWEFLVKIKVK